MLIPIGHEETSVRRLPWVSFAIIAACTLAWILSLLAPGNETVVVDREAMALRYYFAHPYLELDDQLQGFQYFQMRQSVDDAKAPQPPGDEQLAEEQAELDRLTARVLAARGDIPEFRWGLIPAHVRPYTVITHMFMHAGFLHLFGNMLFFYLVGPYIEDVWGRPLFAIFYLAAGVVAVLGFALKYPTIDEPLIGASGAVSGAMGAFMVRYWNTKITFFYTLYLKRWTGTFAAPAWLMLGLWLLREVLFAQGLWVLMPGAAGNVAHWAHAYGFAFGVVAALVVKKLRVEERFVDRAIEQRRTVFDNSVVDEAVELARQGRGDEAMRRLEAELGRSPDNEGAVAALWGVALGRGRGPEVVRRVLPVIRRGARDGELEVVRTYWIDLIRTVPEVDLDAALAVRVTELLLRGGHAEEAAESAEWLAPRLGEDTPVALVIRAARVAHDLHMVEAARLADLARQHPGLGPEASAELARMVDEEPGAGDSGEARAAPDVARTAADAGPGPSLEIVEAIPHALEGGCLTLAFSGAQRELRLDQVRAVAAAVVDQAEAPSSLILDLLLDEPGAGASRNRVVRLRASRFDARALVGGDDPDSALRTLLERLLTLSGARPVPDRESVLGRPFRRYTSLGEYQRLLGTR